MKKLFFLVLLLLFVTSCSVTNKEINEVVNHVTNEITTKNVTVEDYTIKSLEDNLNICIEKVETSVVGVILKAEKTVNVDGDDCTFLERESLGSGVIYKKIEHRNAEDVIDYYTYYAYTNDHVAVSSVAMVNHKLFVYLKEANLEIEAETLGSDAKLDLAIIKFNTYVDLNPIELANIDNVKKGDFVVAIGCPEGFDYYRTSTFGIISNLRVRRSSDTDGDGIGDFVSEFVLADAAINHGNSGGGLFTLDGKLLGIPSLKIVSNNTEGMGFSIPSNLIEAATPYLENGQPIIRPIFGITSSPVRVVPASFMQTYNIKAWPNVYDGEQPYGLYITAKSNKGTLKDIDIEVGDIIIKVNDIKLYDSSDLSIHLNGFEDFNVSDTVTITYYSSKTNELKTIDVVLKAE